MSKSIESLANNLQSQGKIRKSERPLSLIARFVVNRNNAVVFDGTTGGFTIQTLTDLLDQLPEEDPGVDGEPWLNGGMLCFKTLV